MLYLVREALEDDVSMASMVCNKFKVLIEYDVNMASMVWIYF